MIFFIFFFPAVWKWAGCRCFWCCLVCGFFPVQICASQSWQYVILGPTRHFFFLENWTISQFGFLVYKTLLLHSVEQNRYWYTVMVWAYQNWQLSVRYRLETVCGVSSMPFFSSLTFPKLVRCSCCLLWICLNQFVAIHDTFGWHWHLTRIYIASLIVRLYQTKIMIS